MADKPPNFTRIALKYKNLDAFAKAARTTFAKGRMTLKSKKNLQEAQRIVLCISIPEKSEPIDIVCEVTQRLAAKPGEPFTFGVRWLNFTEKKLSRLLESGSAPPPATEPPKPPTPEPPPPEKPAPPAPEPEAAPPKPVVEPEPEPPLPETEYIILGGSAANYPYFEDKPFAIIPKARKAFAPPKKQASPPADDRSRDEPAPPVESAPTPPKPQAPPPANTPEIEVDTSLDVQPVPAGDDLSSEKPAPPSEPPLAETPATAPEPVKTPTPEPAEASAPVPEPVPPPAPVPVTDGLSSEKLPPPAPAPAADDLSSEEPAPPSEPPLAETPATAPEPVETLAPEPPEAPAAEPALEESAAEEKAPAPAAEAAGATAAPAKPFTAEELAALGVFLQKFLRLILNPARAEGTEADRPRALFEEFKTLMAGREEMGIYVRSVGKGREFLLLGDTIGTVNLKAELPPSLFAELAPKLVEVFTAKGLIGIQLKRYQTEATFRALVSELGRYRPGEQTPEDLASALLQQGVFQASVVHEADRIEKACELDFRADITLSRLRGDVKRLRLMAAAIAEDPAALWTLRVEDALKTVKDGALRAELLLFADLVTAGQTEIAETDLVREIVRASPIELVVDAAAALGARYEKLAARAPLAAEPDAEKIKVSRLLRQLTARLTADSPDAALQLMGGLYRKGVFTLEELPPELRERVMLEQYLEFFLSDPPQRLRDFSAIRVARDYANAAQRYVRMIGELARKGDLDSADLLFTTLVEHVRNREPALPERPQLARAALSGLAEQDLPATLVGSLPGVDKEKRERLAAIIYAAGKSAVGPILDLLATVEDRNLRRLLCEILSRMGEAAAPLLLARARDQDSAWHLTRNLVMVLGDIKSPLLKDDLAWALAHPHPRVREEALVYAAKVIGADAEALMVRGLADPDPQVRRRAVRVLARLPALGDAAVLGLLELTAARPASEPGPEEERTVAAAAEVIAKLGPRALPDGRTLEGVLAEALEGEAGRGLLGRLSGAKSLRTAKMKAALLEALGKVGGPESKKLVAGFIKDKDALVKQSAQAALTRLSAGRSGS